MMNVGLGIWLLLCQSLHGVARYVLHVVLRLRIVFVNCVNDIMNKKVSFSPAYLQNIVSCAKMRISQCVARNTRCWVDTFRLPNLKNTQNFYRTTRLSVRLSQSSLSGMDKGINLKLRIIITLASPHTFQVIIQKFVSMK